MHRENINTYEQIEWFSGSKNSRFFGTTTPLTVSVRSYSKPQTIRIPNINRDGDPYTPEPPGELESLNNKY